MEQDWPSVEEFRNELQETIETIRADMEAYEERVAIQRPDDGKTTIQRALDALKRPERFKGEHNVAATFLRSQGAHGASFTKVVR